MPKSTALVATAARTPVTALLDPSGLGPIPAVPLVPEETLRKHHVSVPNDNRFRAAARLLQALWREDRELPAGTFIDDEGKRRRLGSSITRPSGQAGANFLSPAIAQVAGREIVYRELGAMYDVHRLRTNLLSSMPLSFNLFGLLKRDMQLTTRFMAELFPDFMHEVTSVQFEHSPGRGKAAFTGDHSAFDVFIRGTTKRGLRAFVAFEVKYSESMQETVPLRLSDRLIEIALGAELYADVELSPLWRNPLQQLSREHALAQTILDRDLADAGLFVVVAPELNHLVQQATETYAGFLNGPRQGRAHFVNVTLERLIEVYAAIKMETFARALHRRYCDWWVLDGELALDDFPAPPADATVAEPEQAAA